MILRKAFLNCKSIEYVGYDNWPGKVCMDNNKFGIDLPYITGFEHSTFESCSSLGCIKLYRNQSILSRTFEKCTNLSRVLLS